jgi:hypothetical protein
MKILVSIVLIVGGLFYVNQPDKCINLHVDGGGNQVSSSCIPSPDNTNALVLLRNADYKIEGTVKYGNAVVCRVNGMPAPELESCKDMPPAEAYWAVLIKKHRAIPLFNEWGWAQTGINEVYLSQGDSLGLVFVVNGEVKWPS